MNKIKWKFFLFLMLICVRINAEVTTTKSIVSFDGFSFLLPKGWKQKRTLENCLHVVPSKRVIRTSLTVCNDGDALDTKYFQKNNNEWETKSEGIPQNVQPQIREGMMYLKAVVSCRTSDESGMHLDECFIAEVISPNGSAISFLGKGNKANYDLYEQIIFSVKK